MNLPTTIIYVCQTEQDKMESELISNYIIPIGVVLIGFFILYRLIRIFQLSYASRNSRPLIVHRYFKLKKLNAAQRSILKNEHAFYKKLNSKQQHQFEHRVANFMHSTKFLGKQDLIITTQMKVLIAATAVMLTFGFRKYLLDLIKIVIVYPEHYYSEINEVYHKGETNPQLKAIVFSWKDFKQGYEIDNDNLNLGIHEFGHAIHLNAAISNDISSTIFNQGFSNLMSFLQNHQTVREDLIASKYFRTYAYTNHFEFFAVLLENFIETPAEFKMQFPQLYKYMRQMLNFKFAGY
ncbi:zinc-dependent peptidase [Winogradskyella bathintestinalis]|uniref:Zinc-dependent peptidase n=1 Tax=Winogradskyella bathintestinalis TaxID=3035208 RepID=A0ABT7ZSN1_9FLAO|nr:zinc-dependent peptidase [Winogradskyella bathintestinalis]MDN3492031.1 zinc-dependent peptidase [Winogradskyella bathintestinalis]